MQSISSMKDVRECVVILVSYRNGLGTEEDPCRVEHDLWTKSGSKLCTISAEKAEELLR